MTGMEKWTRDRKVRPRGRGLQPHQQRATAAPHMPFKQLADEDDGAHAPENRSATHRPAKNRSAGNFHDLDQLIEQLSSPPVFELGTPLPNEKFLPQQGLSNCPAAHNRALLDEDAD